MLTTVASNMQPQFAYTSLTLVDMGKLKTRLEEAMGKDITRSDLAQAIKAYGGSISRTAMSKWLDGSTEDMKAVHAFAVAERCNVSAEWLATGKGNKERAGPIDPLPPHRRALLRMYASLPAEVRLPIRQLIESLAAINHPNYAEDMRKLGAKTAAARAKKEIA